jgi:Icc-related predicted phosphoesterase
MRILAFSDLHRDSGLARAILEASAQADVVVGAGDFATKGLGLAETMHVLAALTVPAVFVAGNHDDLAELRLACRGNEAIHVLHGEKAVIGGIAFFGLGFEVPAGPRDEPWNQRLREDEAELLMQDCPDGAVLVTHSPPFGVADLQKTGVHEGSHAIRRAAERTRPRLHLCGHIHHAWGTSGLVGQCKVHNLGPSLNWHAIG